MANLAASDVLMGIYMIIIAGVDVHFRGEYEENRTWWKDSELCTIAGFLATLSGEMSVAILTLITVDRFIAICLSFQMSRLTIKQLTIVQCFIWVVMLIICIVPCFNSSYFHYFYASSDLCLPLPIFTKHSPRARMPDNMDAELVSDIPKAWEYSVFIFICINGIAFLVISILYLAMFISAKKTRAAARSVQLKDDLALAKKMILIVGTDALCWIPTILVGIFSLIGNTISPTVNTSPINKYNHYHY